jgi:hypothetical protein
MASIIFLIVSWLTTHQSIPTHWSRGQDKPLGQMSIQAPSDTFLALRHGQ